ncbi:MAG TPA: tetratricopeptide repeat protein [Verrucomicrobiae bacterium]|nr:tetratricopeptide repeat protein [Verrucomicrobiae bacterium]
MEISPVVQSGRTPAHPRWLVPVICAGLLILTAVAFSPVARSDFIKFDDHQYVVENGHVLSGLTWPNVKWAFTSGYASNWHPLTWISHMTDVQLFGLRPAAHHLTSLVLHLLNAVLVFLLLNRLTGRLWACGMVAILFGVHPLHVESVAWVAERKDVLSTFFFLLSIWAYSAYANDSVASAAAEPEAKGGGELTQSAFRVPHRAGWFFCLALLLFAFGLMSKPMLVTMPFLLLLLDLWPLDRMKDLTRSRICILVLEKIPFLLLAILSSLATFLAQSGSHSVTAGLPLRLRAINALVSYVKYLGKAFWPHKLAIYYPHPDTRYGWNGSSDYPLSEQWGWPLVVAALLFLAAACGFAFLQVRRRPWFFVGWFWFLGSLVPVIGLIQVGMQGMADRYMYIPSIGLFICVAWGAGEIAAKHSRAIPVLAAFAAVAIALCGFLTWRQTSYWKNNWTLFWHALEVTPHNAVAECNVGEDLAQQGNLAAAEAHFRAALSADPRYPLAYLDLGTVFELKGDLENAAAHFATTVRLRPWSESARLRFAGALNALGRRDEALTQYAEVLKLDPGQNSVHLQRANILAAQNKVPEAVAELKSYLSLKPDSGEALAQLGRLLAGQGRLKEALEPLGKAAALIPANAGLHFEFGKALMLAGNSSAAAAQFKEVVRLDPQFPVKLLIEAEEFLSRRQFNEAFVRLNSVLWLQPDSPRAQAQMAWLLATHPSAQFRNGARAVRLAQRALQLTSGQDTRCWAALDAAFAECGRFDEAIEAAHKTRELALAAQDNAAAQACESRLALYQDHKPYHQ